MKLTKDIKNKIKQTLKNMSDDKLEKYFPKDTKPKGWISIEDHLPMFMVNDLMQGYSEYRVIDKDGNESIRRVTDHMIWYYEAKEAGITHWWNN